MALSAVATSLFVPECVYWVVRVKRRVRGDSYFVPLASRWLYILGAVKLVSGAMGLTTLGAGSSVVPLGGVRAVWNGLKVSLGLCDVLLSSIDTSSTPWRPSMMPMLVVLMVAATWLSIPMLFIFVWVTLSGLEAGRVETYCLGDMGAAAATALLLDCLSLVVLPAVDYIGGGLSRIGAPMCYRDPHKSAHPRITFGRSGQLPASRLVELQEEELAGQRLSVATLSPLRVTDAFSAHPRAFFDIAHKHSRRLSSPTPAPPMHTVRDHPTTRRRSEADGVERWARHGDADGRKSSRVIHVRSRDTSGQTTPEESRTPIRGRSPDLHAVRSATVPMD